MVIEMRNILLFTIVLLNMVSFVKGNLNGELKKKDIADKGPVLSASILENLFLPKECIYYTKLSSPDRSMDYTSPAGDALCDAKLSPGWYRFTTSAGSTMATTCVPHDHCSAVNPGWLSGDHPSIKDGKVERKVCFHGGDKCCHASVNVEVRNCGPFYVYKLVGVPCPFRYCGEHFVPSATTAEPSTIALPPFPTEPEPSTTALPPFPTEPPSLYDECSHYKTLDEPDRAASYYNPFVVNGDFTLLTDWYRFDHFWSRDQNGRRMRQSLSLWYPRSRLAVRRTPNKCQKTCSRKRSVFPLEQRLLSLQGRRSCASMR